MPGGRDSWSRLTSVVASPWQMTSVSSHWQYCSPHSAAPAPATAHSRAQSSHHLESNIQIDIVYLVAVKQQYGLELPTNRCEVSQCPEKAPTRAFSLLKVLTLFKHQFSVAFN